MPHRSLILPALFVLVAASVKADGIIFSDAFTSGSGTPAHTNGALSKNGWTYIDILQGGANGAGEHASIGIRASGYTGTGGNNDTTKDGTGNFLVGGRSSIFDHLVVDSIVEGTTYTFTVWSVNVGSSGANFRAYFSTAIPGADTTAAASSAMNGQFAGATGTTVIAPDSSYTWAERQVTLIAGSSLAGQSLYINLQSDRDVSTAIVGWDDVVVTATAVPEPSTYGLMGAGTLTSVASCAVAVTTTPANPH